MRYSFAVGAIVALIFVTPPTQATSAPYTRAERCNTDTLFYRAQQLVASVPVYHSETRSTYREKRLYRKGHELLARSDYTVRTIPIALVNTSTCELVQSVITRRITNGTVPTFLITDDRQFLLSLEHRAYGMLWNGWNTPLHVVAPDNFVVVALKWKPTSDRPAFTYSPESADVVRAFPHIPNHGREHFRSDMAEGFATLERVPSLVVRGMSVADVHRRFFPNILESIVTIEQADDYQLEEYHAGRTGLNPLDRAFVVLATNPERGFAYTVSKAGARGKMQIMPRTCDDMRMLYPLARIPRNCFADDHGHPVELATAALVVDYHLSILYDRLARSGETPEVFASRSEIHMLLRAAYNTGPGRVAKAVRTRDDWHTALLNETRGYLAKALGFDGVVR